MGCTDSPGAGLAVDPSDHSLALVVASTIARSKFPLDVSHHHTIFVGVIVAFGLMIDTRAEFAVPTVVVIE
jgi:hypothetical protein